MSDTDDRIVEMQFNLQDGLHPFDKIEKNALMIPTKDIPVTAVINGKKMEVGKAHIDPETHILTTRLDPDSPAARIWLDSTQDLNGSAFSRVGLVSISEVTFQHEVGNEDLGTTPTS